MNCQWLQDRNNTILSFMFPCGLCLFHANNCPARLKMNNTVHLQVPRQFCYPLQSSEIAVFQHRHLFWNDKHWFVWMVLIWMNLHPGEFLDRKKQVIFISLIGFIFKFCLGFLVSFKFITFKITPWHFLCLLFYFLAFRIQFRHRFS